MQKILVVEDDIDIQDILKNHLIDAGYEVIKTRVKDMFPNTPHGEVIIKLVRKL